jgi:hypothetical protein
MRRWGMYRVSRQERFIQGLAGKREGKRQVGIYRRRWKDILKWDFKKGAEMHGLDSSVSG